jgi:SNF2 family DNA or RNA helicase
MRHLCGLSKVKPAIEWITDFLINVPEEKLVVFVHHKDVGKLMMANLESEICDGSVFAKPLEFTSEMSIDKRFDVIEEFKNGSSRVLVASTLAAGEGLNLQFCSNAIILERQWNPANEEQAEGRFPREGTKASQVNINYYIAVGTIDEYLTEIVERKREYVSKTLDGQGSKWDETSIMKELADKIVSQQRQKWTLK